MDHSNVLRTLSCNNYNNIGITVGRGSSGENMMHGKPNTTNIIQHTQNNRKSKGVPCTTSMDIDNTTTTLPPPLLDQMVNNSSIPTTSSFTTGNIITSIPTVASTDDCVVWSETEIVEELNQLLDVNYAQDIHLCHLESEDREWNKRKLYPDYRSGTQVTHHMRSVLVDWLIEVCEEYGLGPQTLFLAVNYIDRFFEKKPVAKNTVQLVGITCMLLACKLEEIDVPLVNDFIYITDNAYTRENVLLTEKIILGELNFQLSVTTIHDFLSRFLVLSYTNPQVIFLAKYLSEICLTVYPFVRSFRPSMIAASVMFIAQIAFGIPVLVSVFEAYTGYCPSSLRSCIRAIYSLHEKVTAAEPGRLTAVRDKYNNYAYGGVASVPLSPEALMF